MHSSGVHSNAERMGHKLTTDPGWADWAAVRQSGRGILTLLSLTYGGVLDAKQRPHQMQSNPRGGEIKRLKKKKAWKKPHWYCVSTHLYMEYEFRKARIKNVSLSTCHSGIFQHSRGTPFKFLKDF